MNNRVVRVKNNNNCLAYDKEMKIIQLEKEFLANSIKYIFKHNPKIFHVYCQLKKNCKKIL